MTQYPLSSSGYGYNWNTSANGNDNHQFTATLAVPYWGQTLELDDISIGVLDQAATNLVFLRTQNGTEHTKLQEYHSKKVDYEVAKVAIGVGTPFSFSKEIMHTPLGEVLRVNLLMADQAINRTILLPSPNVKHAAAGEITLSFYATTGHLTGSGGNDSGQLGLSHDNNQTWPTQILPSGVKSIASRSNQSYTGGQKMMVLFGAPGLTSTTNSA